MHFRLLIPLLILGSALSGLAQDPVSPPPATPANPGEMVERLEFPNVDVKTVLDYYARLTGKHVIYDNTVQGQVNIVIMTRLSKDEAMKIIETCLLLNGFTLVPGEDNIIKVIGLTKNPRVAGVPIISDEMEIPDNDTVITYLFKLRYADATELQQVLSQYIAPSLYTSVVALPKSQALLITESSPVLRGVVRVIREIDMPPAEVVSEFIKLERADVKDVLEKLEKIFEKQPAPGGAPGAPAAQAGGARPRTPQNVAADIDVPNPTVTIEGGSTTLTEDAIIIGKIKLTADIRTNRIHVVTRPINLPFVRRLINEFDSDIKFGEPTTRVLRYVSAGDVLEVVVKAITEKGDTNTEVPTTNTPGSTSSNASTSSNFGGSNSSFGGSSSGNGGFSVSEGLSTETKDTTPKAVTVGNTKIIADLRNNAIIVLGNEEAKQKIFQVLDSLDTRAPQVLLKTVIGELSLDNSKDLGFSYFLGNADVNGRRIADDGTDPDGEPVADGGTEGSRSGIGFGNDGIPFLDINRILNARNLSNVTPFLVGGAPGLSAYLAAGDSLGMVVNALEKTGRFRVTQSPVVFTSNNKKAIIASGEEIAVPTQTLSNVNTTGNTDSVASVSSSVQFKQVALQLEVVPLINSDKEVALDILQKLDSLTGASTEVGGSSIPTIATRYIKTNVSVPSGTTIALGGLVRSDSRKSESGIPGLSKIPVLGALFRSKSNQGRRSELIILMKPEVVIAPEELIDLTDREQQKLEIEPDLESTLDANAGARAEKPEIPKEQRVKIR